VNSSRITERIRRIKPSPSTTAADRANELRRQGKDIINLAVGEPDFDTPPNIRDAAARAIENGATRYALMAGTLELRQAIADKLARENGLDYTASEIIATNGAKSGIYSALAISLERGDEVIIPAPYWISYPDMVLANDGAPVTVACPESQGLKLTRAQLGADLALGRRLGQRNHLGGYPGCTCGTKSIDYLGARYGLPTARPRARISDEDVSMRKRCSGISVKRLA
jgi:aspartate aminotransferase